jgi:predicted aspartyl protease
MVPGNTLRQLGVTPIEQIAFQLADERTVEYAIGEVRIRLDGRERTVVVVFGPEDAAPLLGATTLELFNLAVDPVGKRLVPVPGLLMTLDCYGR